MSAHNGYKTLGEHATLAQLHPSTARIAPDEDGLLPDWVIYHELIATARTFLSKALPWPLLPPFSPHTPFRPGMSTTQQIANISSADQQLKKIQEMYDSHGILIPVRHSPC